MNFIFNGIRSFLTRVVGLNRVERAIREFSRFMNIDLLEVAYRNIGILNYKNHYDSGENFLLSEILPRIFTGEDLVFFDVGANIGDISRGLRRGFPQARIWAFEPNPVTYVLLEGKLQDLEVTSMRVGFGSRVENGKLHCYQNDQASGHATVYPDTFKIYKNYGVSNAEELTSFDFPATTLDMICEELGIDGIDFLKIDVEGHELEVLKGGEKLICGRKISVIQFEIADCNVSSRVFLQDFYGQLPQYRLFRLNTNSLIPLGAYSARNEIFQFQNILALRDDFIEKVADIVQS